MPVVHVVPSQKGPLPESGQERQREWWSSTRKGSKGTQETSEGAEEDVAEHISEDDMDEPIVVPSKEKMRPPSPGEQKGKTGLPLFKFGDVSVLRTPYPHGRTRKLPTS